MKKLIAIGEALIDFIPCESDKGIKDISAFSPHVGGAPANVCGAFSKLGGSSGLITQLGADPFGDKIVEELERYNIDCSHILRTDKANTSLAFVALKNDGNREFSFYRNPGADMLLSPDDIREDWFGEGDMLHFCSVSLGDFPMKEAHRKAIDLSLEKNMLVSFDPNLRFNLWNDRNALKKTVLEFMPMAHIVKISDEETEFITGEKNPERARDILFRGNTEIVIYTKGAEGAELFRKKDFAATPPVAVKAIDTTGAGDGFIGAFLYKAAEMGLTAQNVSYISIDVLKKALDFANRFCAVSVTKQGAIASYPNEVK